MHSNAALAFACKLVREHHGEICEVVCKQLLSRGLQMLHELVRGTGQPLSAVKQALLVLMQHNWVSAYLQVDESGQKNGRPPYHMYMAHVDNIIQIVRMPKFLLHIKEEIDDTAEFIIQLLQQNGRLSVEQVIKGVAGRMQRSPDEVREVVRNQFISLVQSHYIERVPSCCSPVPLLSPHPASVKRKGVKAGSEQLASGQAMSLRSMEEVQYQKDRFKLPQDVLLESMMDGVVGANGEVLQDGAEIKDDFDIKPPPAKKQKMKAGSKSATTNDPQTAKPADATTSLRPSTTYGLPGSPSVVLWRLNFEEFNRRFRHQACVDMVADKLDSDAGAVLAAMFSASRAFETKLQEERSTTLSIDEIQSAVHRLAQSGAIEMPGAEVNVIISTIAHDSLELISLAGVGPGGEQYTVNMQRIIDLLRLKQLEAVIRDRFGTPGLRIFRLLLIKGQLEQKQISDFSMMPAKDVRQTLYRMLQAGFLALQDIPKTSDRAPSRTLYTWRVDIKAATERLGSELYRAMHNIWIRLQHEMESEKEVLQLLEEARETGQLNFTLTATQKGRIQRLKKASETLESSMLHIDDMLAIFNNF